jgi:FkbM family methyltransferase
MEWDEWMMVNALVPQNAPVLELGARFGTTSCVLARATNNSGRVLAVEPDSKAHAMLQANRDAHGCNFAIWKGTVASQPLVVASKHYATDTRPARRHEAAVPNADWRQLEARLGAPFDTALIDCEGCIEHTFSGRMAPLLHQLRLVLIEADGTVDYERWYARLRHAGFSRVWRSRDTFMPSEEWSRNITHSAWQRGPAGGTDACQAYYRKLHATTGISTRWLNCLDPLMT